MQSKVNEVEIYMRFKYVLTVAGIHNPGKDIYSKHGGSVDLKRREFKFCRGLIFLL